MRAVMSLVERLMNRPGVTDIVIGSSGAWLDSGSGFVLEQQWPFEEDDHRELAMELVSRGGRHVDVATPFADVRLGDGIRVHAVIPPASPGGTEISIRVPRGEPPNLDTLVATGMISTSEADELGSRVRAGRSFLVAGATGSGKTTLSAAILASLPDCARIITVEDVAELRIAHPHVVSLQARQANVEGAGAIELSTLVRQTLRMRPDYLVVGEMRGAEVLDVLLAHTSGHPGGSTVHARSLDQVPSRLIALGGLAGLTSHAVARLACDAFDDVYFVERTPTGRRLVAQGILSLNSVAQLTMRT